MSLLCRLHLHDFKPKNTHTLKDEITEVVFEVLECRKCGSLQFGMAYSYVDFKKVHLLAHPEPVSEASMLDTS